MEESKQTSQQKATANEPEEAIGQSVVDAEETEAVGAGFEDDAKDDDGSDIGAESEGDEDATEDYSAGDDDEGLGDEDNEEDLTADDDEADDEEHKETDESPKGVFISENKLKVLITALRSCEQNIGNVVRLMEKSLGGDEDVDDLKPCLDFNSNREMELAGVRAADGRVIEGVFDGQNMVGSDGKIYSVPPNYASKSKLVEGDMLKLTITGSGSFIYKQIGPIDRSRVVAELGFDPTVGEYYATSENRRWNVLKASVTYFKGDPNDEIVILIPKNGPSKWAAVENVIKRIPTV